MKRVALAQAPLDGRAFRRLIDGQLKEKDWQKQVAEALDACGWWWMHVPSNVVVCPRCHTKVYRGIRKGVPDIFAMKPPYLLWIELKTERGQLDGEQKRVRDLLRACGQIWIHARPRDRRVLFDWIANPETALKAV